MGIGARLIIGVAKPFVVVAIGDVCGATIDVARHIEVAYYRAVAAVLGGVMACVVAIAVVFLAIPHESPTNDGVELDMLIQTHGEMQGGDAVATVR